MISIGEIIRSARERKGLTQTNVARHLRVSQATISNIEKGETLPLEIFSKLSRYIGMFEEDVAFILGVQCDEVEMTVAKDKKLSLRDKRVLLTTYAFFTGRSSVWNMEAFLIREADNSED